MPFYSYGHITHFQVCKFCSHLFYYFNIEWMGLGKKNKQGGRFFWLSVSDLFNDGKWIWGKTYQCTNAESNIESGATCQNALGCVLLEQSSQALRGLLKEESEIEAAMLAVGRCGVLWGMLEAAGWPTSPFCFRSSCRILECLS